jgi:hypothetical protein
VIAITEFKRPRLQVVGAPDHFGRTETPAMFTTLFTLVVVFLSVLAIAIYGMPGYVAGSLIVAAFAVGLAAEEFFPKRRTVAE